MSGILRVGRPAEDRDPLLGRPLPVRAALGQRDRRERLRPDDLAERGRGQCSFVLSSRIDVVSARSAAEAQAGAAVAAMLIF